MGYDHFTVNNLSYHGTIVTIVWQKPGGTIYYPLAPAGYSLYVGGQRVMTVDDLAHVTWDSQTGNGHVLDGSATHVTLQRARCRSSRRPIRSACPATRAWSTPSRRRAST